MAKDPADRFATGARAGDGSARCGPSRSQPSRPSLTAGRLEDFAAGLNERERAALRVVLRRSAAAEAQAWHETEQIAMQVFAPAGALLALEDSGAAAALASGKETPADVAAACGADASGR